MAHELHDSAPRTFVYGIGFPPVSDERARVLILGSLPGQRSLQLRQYYGQPRNAFWGIMGRLFNAGPELPYTERTRRLVDSRVALWDVCGAGARSACPKHASVVTNAFADFLGEHRRIGLICFNGSTAAALYSRIVLPDLPEPFRDIPIKALPSTSPAHASMSFDEKLSRWSTVRDHATTDIRT